MMSRVTKAEQVQHDVARGDIEIDVWQEPCNVRRWSIGTVDEKKWWFAADAKPRVFTSSRL